MNELGRAYRDWIVSQTVEGCVTTALDDDHVAFEHERMTGRVNFYAFDDMPEVVELSATDNATEDNLFFLHFELTDLDRAQELFDEMRDVLETVDRSETSRVLLCCTVGMTTTLFASKLTEVASTLSLNYTFEARALEDATREGGSYRAVMLAPQVGFRRREVAEAFPGAVVFEIPGQTFARYDAAGALRMLMGLLGDASLATPDPSDLRVVREMDYDKKVLLISYIHRPRGSTIAWRVYDRYKLVASDEVHKSNVDYHDLEDIIATLRVHGVDPKDLDGVGIALPGSVDFGTVRSYGFGLHGVNVERELGDTFGLRVFVDNNANAGAVGCYVSQEGYDSVTLHTQQVGSLVGGQGTVCNGHLLRGRQGMAGELGALNWQVILLGEQLIRMDDQEREALVAYYRDEAVWSGEGMLPVLATMLQANIAVAAPDAIYLSYDLIDDMDALRAELEKCLEKDLIPDLIHITDYHEKIFVGEMALVLQRLNTSAT